MRGFGSNNGWQRLYKSCPGRNAGGMGATRRRKGLNLVPCIAKDFLSVREFGFQPGRDRIDTLWVIVQPMTQTASNPGAIEGTTTLVERHDRCPVWQRGVRLFKSGLPVTAVGS
jgi:hypothetical protein